MPSGRAVSPSPEEIALYALVKTYAFGKNGVTVYSDE